MKRSDAILSVLFAILLFTAAIIFAMVANKGLELLRHEMVRPFPTVVFPDHPDMSDIEVNVECCCETPIPKVSSTPTAFSVYLPCETETPPIPSTTTPTYVWRPSPTPTRKPPTRTPSPPNSPTPTTAASITPTIVYTPTITLTVTKSPSNTPTLTLTPSPTNSPTATLTLTETPTPTELPTLTLTPTHEPCICYQWVCHRLDGGHGYQNTIGPSCHPTPTSKPHRWKNYCCWSQGCIDAHVGGHGDLLGRCEDHGIVPNEPDEWNREGCP